MQSKKISTVTTAMVFSLLLFTMYLLGTHSRIYEANVSPEEVGSMLDRLYSRGKLMQPGCYRYLYREADFPGIQNGLALIYHAPLDSEELTIVLRSEHGVLEAVLFWPQRSSDDLPRVLYELEVAKDPKDPQFAALLLREHMEERIEGAKTKACRKEEVEETARILRDLLAGRPSSRGL